MTMEVVEEVVQNEDTFKKHKINDEKSSDQPNKKTKTFSAKEFRKQLSEGDKISSITRFLSCVKGNKKHDYLYEYLECGGNCHELLQQLELEASLNPLAIFELVTLLLLQINSKYPNYQNSATEACKYILNTHNGLINKMINLSSSTAERKTVLRLLTAIATMSLNLAQEVLVKVNFNQTNLELLTKHTGQKDSVRDVFIHFLTGFLVDGHYPNLLLLLRKRGLLTSIVKDLQYDNCETVCLVITAMKSHILENPSVSKTDKMKTFSTPVIRDIVNLYNWKGPASFRAQKKDTLLKVEVDQVEKSKVSESVHEFLMVLCTSHKFGVIFRDHMMGLGQKNQNTLMYTVLESLDRPWEHSYAGQLVTKICGSSPDLSKTMWNTLKPYLELRATRKWLNSLNFAKILLSELQPNCIDFCASELTAYQLTQVISSLVLPLPILKTIIPENLTFENHVIKQYVVSLLLEFLKSAQNYLNHSVNWFKSVSGKEDQQKLKSFLSSYITKNFPDAFLLLDNWQLEANCEEIEVIQPVDYLSNVLDILHIYKDIAPQLLESLNNKDLDFIEFLSNLDNLETDVDLIKIKSINLFVDFDNSKFSLKSDLFSFVVPLLLKFYCKDNNSSALTVLNKLFKLTNVFEGCENEINIWLNGVLDLKKFDDDVANTIVEVLRQTHDKLPEYLNTLSALRGDEENVNNFSEIIENLCHENTESSNIDCIKHTFLSPMLLGYLNHLREIELSKHLKIYTQFVLFTLFHSQTLPTTFKNVMEKFTVADNITKYVEACCNKDITVFNKHKGKIDVFEIFSDLFLNGDITEFVANSDNLKLYPDLILNLLQLATFQICSLGSSTSESQAKNFEILIDYIIKNEKLEHENYILTVLGNPNLLRKFSLSHLNKNMLSKILLSCVKMFKEAEIDVEKYLKTYRKKLVRILKKPHKCQVENLTDILKTFNLDLQQCVELLNKYFSEDFNNSSMIVEVSAYCLEQITFLSENNNEINPLHETLITNISLYVVNLLKEQIDATKIVMSFQNYLHNFPCSLKYVSKSLFESLLNVSEYNKENVELSKFLLKKNLEFLMVIKENLEIVCEKKYIILPLLQIICENVNDEFIEKIYEKFEPSLNKALLKPQKVGQHFLNNPEGLYSLVKKCMTADKCGIHFEKVQKYDVSEVFLSSILQAMIENVVKEGVTEKQINNMILTYIHLHMTLFKRKTKNDEDSKKLNQISLSFQSILQKFLRVKSEFDFKTVAQNETFKLFCKFSLKFGVSGNSNLLSILTNLLELLEKTIEKDEARTLFELMVSHSEFLDSILGDNLTVKTYLLSVFTVLCKNWPELMQRNHIPVLLSAYQATTKSSDKIIMGLLQMYENNADQTQFYDFKPFLWNRAAATHYSIRSSIENKLARQPKMGDVLDILQDNMVENTIQNYALDTKLHNSTPVIQTVLDEQCCYDLSFLLPVFSQLLAPENQVQTYRFTKSGALSLTIIGLSCHDEEIRKAACHVLARFHLHMEARQSGKDNLLWIRFIEAVCKGAALLEGFQINNFAAIFLARMALVLTQPNDVMYVPMSQYLTAKPNLDFSTVPELYTYLHSSDVNYKEHRRFALELLRDGLRTEKDFTDFSKSMALKLFSELYSSCISDIETRLLILDVFVNACKLPLGCKVLCESHSLLPQLHFMLKNDSRIKSHERNQFVDKFADILALVVANIKNKYNNSLTLELLMMIVQENSRKKDKILETILEIYNRYPQIFLEEHFDQLLKITDDKWCKYIREHGCEFISENDLLNDDCVKCLRILLFRKYKTS